MGNRTRLGMKLSAMIPMLLMTAYAMASAAQATNLSARSGDNSREDYTETVGNESADKEVNPKLILIACGPYVPFPCC